MIYLVTYIKDEEEVRFFEEDIGDNMKKSMTDYHESKKDKDIKIHSLQVQEMPVEMNLTTLDIKTKSEKEKGK